MSRKHVVSIVDRSHASTRLLRPQQTADIEDPLARALLDEEAYHQLFRQMFLRTSRDYLRGKHSS